MGTVTLANFRLFSQNRAQRDLPAQNELNQLINAVYLDICEQVDLKELEAEHTITTVIDDIDYDLPSDWLRYYHYGGRITSPTDYRRRVRPRTRESYMLLTEQESSIPERFHTYGGEVIIDPPPDDAYTIIIDYQKRPSILSDSTDVTLLTPEWDEALILGTKAKIYAYFQEHEAAMKAYNDFVTYVRGRQKAKDREPWSDDPLGVAWEESDLS